MMSNMASLRSLRARVIAAPARTLRAFRNVGFTLVLLVLFASLEPMYSLDLRSLNIANVTFASDIGSTEISRVSFLSKSNKELQSVAMSDVRAATVLDLSDNRLVSIPAAFFQALTSVRRIVLSKNPLRTFEPKSFAGLPALEEIIIEKSNLTSFPVDFIVDCPNLKRVQINSSYVREIPSKSIANLPALHTIDLSRNNVTVLTDDSFFNLPSIHTLDLSYNNLTSVPTPLFTVSKNWQVLDFRRNNISSAPQGLKDATVDGWVSFERNIWVEVDQEEFANASKINELNLRSMGIFTVHPRAFKGMKALKKLDLGDNVISVLAKDAFDGLDSLEVLSLKENNLRQVEFDVFPPKLQKLGLESNQIDEMPIFAPGVYASSVVRLNMSHNWIWKLETGSQLYRFPNLIELDLSWNRITNFSGNVFDVINSTIKTIHLDYNEIQSVPVTGFASLVQMNRTNVTLDMNPGIGTTPDVQYRSFCPGGSVFSTIDDPVTNRPVLYGCVQCAIGTYHDNETNSCESCQDVSSRAYAAVDGSTTCMFCPYSSDLHLNREQCQPFACNAYCWLTIIVAMGFPIVMMSGKCLLVCASRKDQKSDEEALEEQDEMDDWVVEQLIRQVQATRSTREPTDENAEQSKIYDLPKDTQAMVLKTLQENFFQRREKRREQAAPPDSRLSQRSNASNGEWDDLEWESFEMSRILSRNYHGEVFLGDYEDTQVVVKRLMTLRFDVRELFDTIREVETMLSLRHENIVRYMGTIWTDAEHFCVICEYMPSGDLRALLELEAANAAAVGSVRQSLASMHASVNPDASVMALAWLPTKIKIMRDVVTALAFVHEQNVCHGDLRSRNVLINEGYNAKINDFRRNVNAKYVETTISVTHQMLERSSIDEGPISLPVIAPEAVIKNELKPSTDVYAVGILMAELWCHKNVTFSVANVPGGGVDRQTGSDRGSTSAVSEGMSSARRQELYRPDEERMQRFMQALRACAEDISAEGSGSAAGMSVVASMITERLIDTIEECLHRDPRKRPTAEALVEVFTQLHIKAIQSSVAAKAEAVARSSTAYV